MTGTFSALWMGMKTFGCIGLEGMMSREILGLSFGFVSLWEGKAIETAYYRFLFQPGLGTSPLPRTGLFYEREASWFPFRWRTRRFFWRPLSVFTWTDLVENQEAYMIH